MADVKQLSLPAVNNLSPADRSAYLLSQVFETATARRLARHGRALASVCKWVEGMIQEHPGLPFGALCPHLGISPSNTHPSVFVLQQTFDWAGLPLAQRIARWATLLLFGEYALSAPVRKPKATLSWHKPQL